RELAWPSIPSLDRRGASPGRPCGNAQSGADRACRRRSAGSIPSGRAIAPHRGDPVGQVERSLVKAGADWLTSSQVYQAASTRSPSPRSDRCTLHSPQVSRDTWLVIALHEAGQRVEKYLRAVQRIHVQFRLVIRNLVVRIKDNRRNVTAMPFRANTPAIDE